MKVLHDWLRHWDLHDPNAIALVNGDTEESWSYRQLFARAQSGAQYLSLQKKINKGDRVVYIGKNYLSVIALFFATSRIGAILVPVNFRLSQDEIQFIIQDSSAKLVIVDSDSEGRAVEFKSEFQEVLSLSEFENQTERSGQYIEFNCDENDPAMIIYTSGTTGRPKGATLCYRGLFWNALSTSLRLNLTQKERAVSFLPLFHTGGWNVLTTPFLSRGAQIILTQKFDAAQVLKLSEKYQATLLFGVPTTMLMMAQHTTFESVNLSSVRYAIVGGEPLSLELIQKWHNRKVPVRQGYGLTEFGPNVFSLDEKESLRKMGSIGTPNAYIDVQVINDKNQAALPGEVGELCLRGPARMLGYWNHPEETHQVIVKDWLMTGDLVKFDEEGFFYVVGRKKDMFKSGGENVYPAEIERVILQLPWVKEVAVIGMQNDRWGEVGEAFVSSDKSQFNESELREHCSKNLAKFKVPQVFHWIQELPKSGAGKVLKRDLGTSR